MNKFSGPGRILQTMGMFMYSKVMLVSNKIGIFECIGKGSKTSDEIAKELDLDKDQCEIMMNALAAIEFVQKDEDHYTNSPDVKEFLLKESNNYFGHMLEFQENEWDSWDHLYETLIHKKPMGVDEGKAMDFDNIVVYMKAMNEMGKFPAKMLPSLVDTRRYKTMLDLGCGAGTYSMGFLAKKHDLELTLFDCEDVISLTKTNTQKENQLYHIDYISGDYREYVFEKNYDLVLYSQNMHEHSIEVNRMVFTKIYNMLNSGGTLIIHDYIINEDHISPRFPAVFSVNMMLQTNGRCYCADDVFKCLGEIGFVEIQHIRLGEDVPSSVIIAKKGE